MPSTLRDEAARERIRKDLDRNFVIEAGAGTGKTQLLVERIESLVVSGRVRLRNVVAITFTEKAAAELRVRIRERIELKLQQGGGTEERLRMALEDLEIAPISTIHAFAADLLRERPVEARVDPAFTVADELTASLFRTEAWDRWLEQQKDTGEGPLLELIESGISLIHLRRLGDVLLRYRDVLTGAWDRGEAPQDPLTWIAVVVPGIRACIARTDTDCLDPSDKAVHDLRALEQTLDLFARLGEAEVRRGILSGLKVKIGGRQDNWARGVLGEIKQYLANLHDDLEVLRAKHAHHAAAGAVNWLRGYIDTYQALKAREGMLDFDDLLLYARDLLRDQPNIREYFQQRFEAILVDEFQDTDPLQAEIVFFLAEDGGYATTWNDVRLKPGKLFIVGDPKQSIYAFRRADIETYEQAKEVLLRSGSREDITTNFRSVAPILTAVNGIFQGKMQPPPDGKYQPAYVALDSCPQTRSSDDCPALMLLYPGAKDVVDTDVTSLRRREAETLAAFVRHHVDRGMWKVGDDRRPARFGDVALLFRAMSDVPIYEEALKRYEIPYRVTSSRTFYKREEIGWLLNVLHAVEHPTDAVAVWGALRSPLFGCSDREVYAFAVECGGSLDYRAVPPKGPCNVREAYAVLRELHQERLGLSVPRMVEEVLTRTHALETFLLLPQGEQRVANLAKVVTLARALEESGILTFRAFVHWLRDMEEHAVDEAESPTVEEGDNVIRIMSIHAAKGLEFPIVVVPDLGRGPGGHGDYLLIERTTGLAAAQVGKVGDWTIQTDQYDSLKDHQASRSATERLRLLYVALTRARDALVLPVSLSSSKNSMREDLSDFLPESPEFGKPHRGWLVVNGEEIPRVPDDPPPTRMHLPDGPTAEGKAVAYERDTWVKTRGAVMDLARMPDPIRNPSQLVDDQALRGLQRAGVALESEPGGLTLGALVHTILAAVPLGRPDLVEVFSQYFAKQEGLDESVATRASFLAREALTSTLGQGEFHDIVYREVPFAVADELGLTEGAIDMLIEGPESTTVVDFKTDPVDADRQGPLTALYSAQLEMYVIVTKQITGGKVTGNLIFVQSSDALHKREPRP